MDSSPTITNGSTILAEYDENLRIIRDCRSFVHLLATRQRQLFAQLDQLTRAVDSTSSVIADAAPITDAIAHPDVGYYYRGEAIRTSYAVDAYIEILRRLWADFPSLNKSLYNALRSPSYCRKVIANSPDELFASKTGLWCQRNARPIAANIYVDINISNIQKRTRLQSAARACGLTWGEELEVYGFFRLH